MIKNVRRLALRDIAEYMREQNIQIIDESGDVWVVTANQVDCEESKKLNVEIDVNKLNYIGNKNGARANKV